MFSWDKLNAIIEKRMEVPLNINLNANDETEIEEIAFYNKLRVKTLKK